jgi:phage-related protein
LEPQKGSEGVTKERPSYLRLRDIAGGIWLEAPDAKPLKGFGGAGVLEVVEELDGNAYRAVYTVKFGDFIYVLHAFMKKSKVGSKTPPRDMELIVKRLKEAEEHYRQTQTSKKSGR